ncbi:hypothetical protein OE88DRAFT_1666318, partial [Heliocybe sulcata]
MSGGQTSRPITPETTPSVGDTPTPRASPHPSPTPSITTMPDVWSIPQNMGLMLPNTTTDRLADENGYYAWSVRIQAAFRYAGVWRVVSGEEARPVDVGVDDWDRKNQAVIGWIFNTIGNKLLPKFGGSSTA